MTLSVSTVTGSRLACALMPHAPIAIPAVAGEQRVRVRATTEACRTAARRLLSHAPASLVVVSPHSPRQASAFGLWSGPRLRGDLAAFGAADLAIELPNDVSTGEAIARAALRLGITTWTIPPLQLDHGALVPLWFLAEAGWCGPTCVLALPLQGGDAALLAMGRAIAGALGERRAALVASGDMSHRLAPGAPAGYDRRAHEFDRALHELLAAGRLEDVRDIDPALRDLAAEDASASVLVAAGAIGEARRGCRVLSYEHPYGVGYLVAILLEPCLVTPALVTGVLP